MRTSPLGRAFCGLALTLALGLGITAIAGCSTDSAEAPPAADSVPAEGDAAAPIEPAMEVATDAAPESSAADPYAATEAPADAPAAGDDEAADPAAGGQLRFVPAPDGNEARYLVNETLASLQVPSDAVGRTSAVTGMIVVNADGSIVAGESQFTVDLATLQSDSSRRDNYVRGNTLETDLYPNAEIVLTAVEGLPSPLPTSGEVTFQLMGDLTVHGVTKPATWQVTAQVGEGTLTGLATTSFTFADYNMQKPSVMSVLSVDDVIRLEYQFNLVAQ